MTESLGQILARRRRALGKTLSEAEADTKIRARLLDALENGAYDVLPSPAYVRGYVIAYAKFLGLDPADLVAAYDRESGHTPAPPRLPTQVVVPRGQGQHLPMRTALLALAVLLVIGGLAWGTTRVLRGPEPPPPIPAAGEPTPTAPPSGDATPPADPAVPPVEEPPAELSPFSLTVIIAPESASWLRVTVDGLIAYEGTITGERSMEWEVAEEASVRIGRPAAVTLLRDGAPVEIPAGDPPTVVLSAAE
ncbi:MAG TPA: RodZ domain-containing protein [Coriobacteriia bacterium]|nr:RodZ domain-containing protein [Coriobacteriia bacterium]